MAKYDSYKDSGVDWLGAIPSGWEVRKLHSIAQENTCVNSELRSRNQLQFRYGTIVQKSRQDEDDKAVLNVISRYICVLPNDIVINGLNLNYDFISKRVGRVQEKGIITSAYIVLRPLSEALSNYLTYLFKVIDSKKMLHGMGTGVRLTLSFKELKNALLPLPPLSEQKAIADYLDRYCARVDEAIAREERLIALLNERKEILISQAVTRGLDPTVELKDSGVDWIGLVPAGWEVSRIGKRNSIVLGKMLSMRKVSGDSTLEKYYCAANVHFDGVSNLGLKSMWFTAAERNQYLVKKGDLLVVEGGAGAGGCAIVENDDEKVYVQNSILILRDKHGDDLRYVKYLLEGFVKRGYIEYVCNKATIPHFTKQKLSSVPMPLPAINEQQKIADYLDAKCATIDSAIAQKREMIRLLQERKEIVINAVVTGKEKVA